MGVERGDIDGFGCYGYLEVTHGGEEVVCHECGARRRALGSHVFYVHAMTAAAYRAAHGLAPGSSLGSPALRRRSPPRTPTRHDQIPAAAPPPDP